MNTEKSLQVDNVSCVRQYRLLFTPISFELHSAQLLIIEGANGSGKSSLLRLLSGLSTSPQGIISWQGTPIQNLQSLYWHDLHYISHANGIKPGLTILENLQLAAILSSTERNPLIRPIYDQAAILEHLQLTKYKNTFAKYLSAGQKRRLALAKLFLFFKPLWILDEPLTALDAPSQHLFLSHLQNHLQAGGLAIISSHHAIHFPTFSETSIKTLRLESC